jgi:carotenoid 1,2-hydratase
MSSLPLFDPTAHPDGWHNVRAPGGYEWWYFDAEDRATDTQIVVIFMQGFIFHPGYLRAFDRYIKRPTKHLPPTAADFPCVYACVYRAGKIWKQFFTQYKREDFAAARDRVDVTIGPNRLWTDENGAYQLDLVGTPWKLTAHGPITEADQEMRVRLTFAPTHRHEPIERRFLSREMTRADHHWTIAAPRCEASGYVQVDAAQDPRPRTRGRGKGEGESANERQVTSSPRRANPLTPTISPGYGGEGANTSLAIDRLELAGHGYHDHNYGTAPIRQGLHRWIWGRAMFGDRVLTFHHAEPKTRGLPTETHLVEVTDAGARDIAVTGVEADWSLRCKPAMMLSYPSTLGFGDDLTLSNPRVIDPSPFYLRLVFDAVSRGQSSQAFCEIAYPHRLTWPLLGRMIEMSFDKRPTKR